ncbi:hypothetical protein C2869_19560 [Saccharobesus litoralis]|uniref:Uncharacterized protein n=1 Tax=Saccharobesus litoralis TaxID=2172099 RepID=A0A2S0VW98_9ALTE|nr:hypothetical protein [Saccharobesus litoralis]AWB68465.1 hypothetical protein C2869_19560 [Saccharobesus litoralis]
MDALRFVPDDLSKIVNDRINQITSRYDSLSEIIEQLDKSSAEFRQDIIQASKECKFEYHKIQKDIPDEKLIESIRTFNQNLNAQEDINYYQLLVDVQLFFAYLGCETVGDSLHSAVVCESIKKIFEEEKQKKVFALKLAEEIKAAISKQGKNNVNKKHKVIDEVISKVISQWLSEGKPAIFNFVQENYKAFYDASQKLGGYISDEAKMHSEMSRWLESFEKLLNNKCVHKPRAILVKLAKENKENS